MNGRLEQLAALEAGLLGGGDPLFWPQRFSRWVQRRGSLLFSVALLILICASVLIGYEFGTFLYGILR